MDKTFSQLEHEFETQGPMPLIFWIFFEGLFEGARLWKEDKKFFKEMS